MISVVILTKNEENDLPGCLTSVAWSDDIHVLDSYSTDATVDIARNFGASVTQRKFDGYATQRNASLREISYKNPWLLILDADERVPDALQQEMLAFVRSATAETVAARIRRRDFFWGRHLKHVQTSPLYIRLVRPGKVRYEREVNEVLRTDGAVIDLMHPFDHYPFSKGIAHWVAKHNTYSTMEATEVMRSREGAIPFSWKQAFFEPDFNKRRFHQKELFYRLPMRPLIKFLLLYVLKGGFLDGKAGFVYSALQSIYEYMIVLKTREMELSKEVTTLAPEGTGLLGNA